MPTLYEKVAASTNGTEQVLYRLLVASNCQTYQDLAIFSKVSLAYARKVVKKIQDTGIVPDSWLIQLIRMHNVHPEWVLSGCSPLHTHPVLENHTASAGVILDYTDECHDLRNVATTSLLCELQRRIESPYRDYTHDTYTT